MGGQLGKAREAGGHIGAVINGNRASGSQGRHGEAHGDTVVTVGLDLAAAEGAVDVDAVLAGSQNLQDRIQRMPPEFLERHEDSTLLKKIQCLVRSKMSPANTALAYWDNKPKSDYTPMDHVGRGNALMRLKKMEEARAAFETALSKAGDDPMVAREAGIYYFTVGSPDRAVGLLQKAVIQNKRDALALFYLARLQAESKQFPQAIANMRKVEELVPEDWEVHHHLKF